MSGPRTLLPLAVPAGDAVLGILPDLAAALAGGPAVLPYAASAQPPQPPPGVNLDDPDLAPGTAAVVGTSGSTGAPKLAMLTADALRASVTATHEALGGPGRWLLSMPGHHVAGLQVLVRSLVGGTVPVVMDLTGGFTASAFAEATARLLGERRGSDRAYTAVVPTQLARLLADERGATALARYDAVLVGGGPTPSPLRDRGRALGIAIVPTYGMTETCGGCVYAGRPVPGARVRVEPDTGRVLLGGPSVAAGYLGLPDLTAAAFWTDDGVRWFRTDDAGRLVDGVLHLDGRLDDLVNSGGLKVAPRLVEEALVRSIPGVLEAVVVGIPDEEWGEAVAAAVVLDPGAAQRGKPPSLGEVRERLAGELPGYALPRRLAVLTDVPLRGPGKPDRVALRSLLSSSAGMGD